MEPMTLGSPTGSPVTPSGVLPGYLIGDPATPNPSKSQALSPSKRALPFPMSPISQLSPIPAPNQDTPFSRSTPVGTSKLFKYHPTAHDSSSAAPPIIGLFDSLREERNQTPKAHPQVAPNQTLVDGPDLNGSSFRIMSPPQIPNNSMSFFNESTLNNRSRLPYSNFWVTIFGFPTTSVSTILSHFSQCGTIVDKSFPPQNGNWIHLRFSSRMECDKALNYNGKVIANSLMIGVLPCTDVNVTNDIEVLGETREQPKKLRSLSRVTYETTQTPTAVDPSVFAPKLNTGIVSKAMDMIFGW